MTGDGRKEEEFEEKEEFITGGKMVTWKERHRLVVFLGKIEDQKGRRMENEGISSILKGKRDGYCDKKGNWRYHEEGAGQWRKKNLLIGKILRGMITRLLRNSIKRFIEENKVYNGMGYSHGSSCTQSQGLACGDRKLNSTCLKHFKNT